LKILFITGNYPSAVCGIGDYTNKLAVELIALGHNVSVITSIENLPKYSKVDIYNIIEKWDFSSLRKIQGVIAHFNPNIIHIQYSIKRYGKSSFINFLPLLIFKYSNIKNFQTIHEHTENSFLGKVRNYINLSFADGVIAVEENDKITFEKYFQTLRKKTQVTFIPALSNIPVASLTEQDIIRIKSTFKATGKRLVTFFGFINDKKSIENIFESCSPDKYVVVLITKFNDQDAYHMKINKIITSELWREAAFVTGYLEDNKVADLLAASDICIYPFKNGVSSRNASVKASLLQGTYTIATHKHLRGYDKKRNIYYVPINDKIALKKALDNKEINKSERDKTIEMSWYSIALLHIELYSNVLQRKELNG